MEQQPTGRKSFHCLENKPPLLSHLLLLLFHLFIYFTLFTYVLFMYLYSSGTYCVPRAGLALLLGIWWHQFCTPKDKPSSLGCPEWGEDGRTLPYIFSVEGREAD